MRRLSTVQLFLPPTNYDYPDDYNHGAVTVTLTQRRRTDVKTATPMSGMPTCITILVAINNGNVLKDVYISDPLLDCHR